MSYVDGFVVPVPKNKLAAYRRMAKYAGKIWMEYGALRYVESVADDVKPRKLTSFPQSVKLKKGEVVVFSFVEYKSRKQRDRIMKKIMVEPRFKKSCCCAASTRAAGRRSRRRAGTRSCAITAPGSGR